jgi:hypothetical protein
MQSIVFTVSGGTLPITAYLRIGVTVSDTKAIPAYGQYSFDDLYEDEYNILFIDDNGCEEEWIYAPLRLLFNDIANADTLVGDASEVDDWNTFFDLPAFGTPFISVSIDGDEVSLWGATSIEIKPLLMYDEGYQYIVKVLDDAKCVTVIHTDAFSYCELLNEVSFPVCIDAGYYEEAYDYGCFGECYGLLKVDMPLLETAGELCFTECGIVDLNTPLLRLAGRWAISRNILTTCNFSSLEEAGVNCFIQCEFINPSFPALTTAGAGCFASCNSYTNINLPVCTSLGPTTGDDNVFNNIINLTITLTIPCALNNDGDVLYLTDPIQGNTVTIVNPDGPCTTTTTTNP